ncbi:LysR family transcriptional regulator [Thermoleophilia bacterium SCSIO 60948]|nr:LysR family transcriptional regulator [Thermoleophilia bacterium SCSIO 60948]
MRVEQLEYALAVIRQGSFRRAAEELHISQPALSESVRNLERELGVQLVDRKRGGVEVSEAGRELLPRMLDVIGANDDLRRACDEHHRGRRVIRLGTVTAATGPLLSPVVRRFRDLYPSSHVELVLGKRDKIDSALLDGSMDLALVNLLGDEWPTADLSATELLRGVPVACISTRSPLTAHAELTPADLIREPLIAMRAGYVMHDYVTRLLEGLDPVLSCSADGSEMGKFMVAGGLGVAILPDYSVAGDPLERSGEITSRPIAAEPVNVRLVLQHRSATALAPTLRALHDQFVARARELGGGLALVA